MRTSRRRTEAQGRLIKNPAWRDVPGGVIASEAAAECLAAARTTVFVGAIGVARRMVRASTWSVNSIVLKLPTVPMPTKRYFGFRMLAR
jgi:hypothetical protein